MKKLAVIIIFLVYGMSSSGMTLQFHYCCGQLVDIELTAVATASCDDGPHEMEDATCCEDQSVDLRISTDQKNEKSLSPSFRLHDEQKVDIPDFQDTVERLQPVSSSPKIPSGDIPIYLFNCVYRI